VGGRERGKNSWLEREKSVEAVKNRKGRAGRVAVVFASEARKTWGWGGPVSETVAGEVDKKK